MSQLSELLSQGFSALSSFGGESLTFDGSSVTGLVNRKLSKVRDSVSMLGGQKPDFSVLGFSEVEVLIASVGQPEAGDSFVDAYGYRHRVRFVTKTDITWVCYCFPAKMITPSGVPFQQGDGTDFNQGDGENKFS